MEATRITAPEDTVWSGRTDGETAEHLRWHQRVTVDTPVDRAEAASADAVSAGTASAASASTGAAPTDAAPAPTDDIPAEGAAPRLHLIGFACDEGVRRNKGRVGAAEAPDALRSALAPLAVHADFGIHDAGTVEVPGQDLEDGQETLGRGVAALLETGEPVVVLGGGHETAWGSYLGRTRAARLEGRRVGVLNLDAHFDLREADEPSSGTPFLQMARADREAGREFDYTVLGISEPNNTGALFATARELGVEHLTDEQCQPRHLDAVLEVVDRLVERADAIHLSIDLDVMPAATAPGVSAPAGYGVPVEVLQEVCHRVARSGKLALVDVVELCPRLDVDGRTARTAARLVTTLAHDALSTTTSHPTGAGASPCAGGTAAASSPAEATAVPAASTTPTPSTGRAGNTTGERHE